MRFSPLNPFLLVTAGSDGLFKVWDTRDCGYRTLISGNASDTGLNCAVFNNVNEFLIAASGDEDGQISIWDMRMPSMCINDLSHHTKQVTSLEWHPIEEQKLISGGDDGKVYVWDNSKCGEEQARKDYEDGPPELVFPHVHH